MRFKCIGDKRKNIYIIIYIDCLDLLVDPFNFKKFSFSRNVVLLASIMKDKIELLEYLKKTLRMTSISIRFETILRFLITKLRKIEILYYKNYIILVVIVNKNSTLYTIQK